MLLQASPNSNNLIDLCILVIVVLLTILITRVMFSIPTIVRNLKTQTNLLKLIAKKQGASYAEVEKEIIKPIEWEYVLTGQKSKLVD